MTRTFHASELPRVMACHGSPGLVDQAPKRADTRTEDAQEGEAFHHFSAELFLKRPVNVGDRAPNGYLCNADMLADARDYVALFDDGRLELQVETPAHWSYPHGEGLAVFNVRGRSDLRMFNEAARTLAVVDAKYGFRYVEPDTWQNVSYAIEFMLALGPRAAHVDKVVLGIYQPRIGGEPFRYVELTTDELYDKYQELTRVLSTHSDGLTTGPHCRHCPAALGCEAHRRATYNSVDVALASNTYAQPADTMLRNEIDNLDRAAEAIKQRKALLEDAAKSALRAGREVPGLSTEQQKGNRAWRDDVDVAALREFGRTNQVSLLDEVSVTPAEAERRLKAAGREPELVGALVHRPDRGFKLVKRDRAEAAAAAFGDAPPPRVKKAGKRKT